MPAKVYLDIFKLKALILFSKVRSFDYKSALVRVKNSVKSFGQFVKSLPQKIRNFVYSVKTKGLKATLLDYKKNIRRKHLYVTGGVLLILFLGILSTVLIANRPKPKDLGKFPKGVLVVNTNKSIYAINERVEIGLASLDSKGNTLCNSNLKLTITAPSGQKTENSTQAGNIVVSSSCLSDNNVTNDSDYGANYTPTDLGDYKIELANLDTSNTATTSFSVKDGENFSVNRFGAVRLNPFKAERYPMVITVTTKEDFKGQLVEQITMSFNVIWQGKSKVETVDDKQTGAYKTITWEVDLKAGESKEFIYEYAPPKISPEFYTLGTAKLIQSGQEVFKENRPWQVASSIY